MKSGQLRSDRVSPGVRKRPGVVVHPSQVFVDVVSTVAVETLVDVDIEIDTAAGVELESVLLGVFPVFSVAVVTLIVVEVSKVVSVQVCVVDKVVTVVSVKKQLVLAVMEDVATGRGDLVKVLDDTVRFPVGKGGISERGTELDIPTVVPVEKSRVLELSTGYSVEVGFIELVVETLKAVDDEVSFPIDVLAV